MLGLLWIVQQAGRKQCGACRSAFAARTVPSWIVFTNSARSPNSPPRVANHAHRPMTRNVSFHLVTPPPGPSGAAIAVFQIEAASPDDLESALRDLGIAPVAVGRVALRRLAGIDTGLVARWSPGCVHLMPHGGRLIIDRVRRHLARVISQQEDQPCSRPMVGPEVAGGARVLARCPEAADLVEACTIDALARAASPMALDSLLNQRDLWRTPGVPRMDAEDERMLQRLIDPATVVLLGPPNVGKSTLTNALARRGVSIVADEPGTTRDHVGVMLDLGGLVARWIDAPGIRTESTDPIERDAGRIALAAAEVADLILVCEDAAAAAPPECLRLAASRPSLRVGLRADLGAPAEHAGLSVSITAGHAGRSVATGLEALAGAVRDSLVPRRLLSSRARWRFHSALAGE